MEKKSFLKKYFNEKCTGAFGPGRDAMLGTFSAALMLTSGSTPVISLGIGMSVFVLGQLNLWQKAATDKYIWSPKVTKSFGL
ncbi:MAG: hypothetical protein R3E57_07365 [Porticoccaceae bacterium]